MGEIHLGSNTIEMMQPGVARFASAKYDRTKLPLLKDQELKVLINVVSGRRSFKDNLLDCSIFEDNVARAAREGVKIDCTLIGER